MGTQDKKKDKRVEEMLCVVAEDLEELLQKTSIKVEGINSSKTINKIDTVVNSASPDLMGGDEGTVDKVLHDLIDKKLKENGKNASFNQMICRELARGNNTLPAEGDELVSKVRCARGGAVLTGGYGCCDHVIHAVGTSFQREASCCDGKLVLRRSKQEKNPAREYCSSDVQLLESCYHEIVNLIRKYPDIRNVAVPIIGAGNYKIDFETAAKIAVSAMGNALMEWKLNDEEMFNTSGLENIIFFVKLKSQDEKNEIWHNIDQYGAIYRKKHQVVCQDSFTAQRQYYNEIRLNDEKRGYFAFAGSFRRTLLQTRMLFGWVSNKLKEKIGKSDWQERRMAVEKITALKMLLPVAGFLLARYCTFLDGKPAFHVVSFILFYSMTDTITYLLALLMMADIQKPSANIIRSLLMLLFNYVEVSCGIAFFYYVYGAEINFKKALAFGVLGEGVDTAVISAFPDMVMGYVNAGVKFFFVTVVFGYLVQHMRRRKFRGEN